MILTKWWYRIRPIDFDQQCYEGNLKNLSTSIFPKKIKKMVEMVYDGDLNLIPSNNTEKKFVLPLLKRASTDGRLPLFVRNYEKR